MIPKVSILIPSYNHAPYLRACLDRALSQTVQEIEVILVDDGSTDESLGIARSFADPRLKVFQNEKNLGTYGTQNRGLEECSGEFVAILNSDDFWAPQKLERQLAMFEENPQITLCYTVGDQVDDHGNLLPEDQHLNWPRSGVQDLLPWMLSSNRLLASSVMFRRGSVKFDESLRFSGDWVAWLKLVCEGPAGCVDEALTFWRQHPTNSYRRSETVTLEEIRVRRAILARRSAWLKLREDKNAIRRGLSNCALDLTALYILTGNMRLAKGSASLAMRLRPTSSTAHKRMALSFMPAVVARQRLWGKQRIELQKGALSRLTPLDLPV